MNYAGMLGRTITYPWTFGYPMFQQARLAMVLPHDAAQWLHRCSQWQNCCRCDFARHDSAEPNPIPWSIRQVQDPSLNWYRNLYRGIGEEWLWFSRLNMSDDALAGIVHSPAVEVYVVEAEGTENGLLELDFRSAGDCELAFIGLSASLRGQGAGRWLMNRAIERAWSRPIRRFWVHTCTLDHPDVLAFYIRSGFKPYRRQVEIADDPRLAGKLPHTAAPQIPLTAR